MYKATERLKTAVFVSAACEYHQAATHSQCMQSKLTPREAEDMIGFINKISDKSGLPKMSMNDVIVDDNKLAEMACEHISAYMAIKKTIPDLSRELDAFSKWASNEAPYELTAYGMYISQILYLTTLLDDGKITKASFNYQLNIWQYGAPFLRFRPRPTAKHFFKFASKIKEISDTIEKRYKKKSPN